MCGIAGIVSPFPILDSSGKIVPMAQALRHRGPEGTRFYNTSDGNLSFAHSRLSVIDISDEAAQPMHYLDRYVLIYNGELFNYRALRFALLKKGLHFRTKSDSEVILAAYHAYGKECLEHFEGMYSFAVYDSLNRQLFIARDRFGEKPFYYTYHDNALYFASEIKALKAGGVFPNADPAYVLRFLSTGLAEADAAGGRTSFTNIFQLPPATYALIDISTSIRVKPKSYWQLHVRSTTLNENDVVEKFKELFCEAVQKRLVSDVPVAFSLSGGLDSSSILATAINNGRKDPVAFSAIFPGFKKDESAFINALHKQFSFWSVFIEPGASAVQDKLVTVAKCQEEPMQSMSIVLQYLLYEQAASHGFKVITDGQGADELLAGYDRYLHWFLQEIFRSIGYNALQENLLQLRANGREVSWSFKNYPAAYLRDLTARQLNKKLISGLRNHEILDSDFALANSENFLAATPKRAYASLNELLLESATLRGLPELLRYADRNSMAHGLEVRLPFLHHPLAEFIFSLPSSFKIRDGFTKWILRKAMEPSLPPAITWRKDKTGFEPPQADWMSAAALKPLIMEARQKLYEEKIIKKEWLQRPVLSLAAHNEANYDWRILSLYLSGLN